jgi:hypothetical protein
MRTSLRLGRADGPAWRRAGLEGGLGAVGIALAVTTLLGCGRDAPPATVEGTLRLNGRPVENCLVTFLPEPGQEAEWPCSTGLTDKQGSYRLLCSTQEEGVAIGWHRVTIQDLSASTGVRRRDHGTVDAQEADSAPPPPARRSRVPKSYTSPARTPLRKEVKPGHQVIDLDIK